MINSKNIKLSEDKSRKAEQSKDHRQSTFMWVKDIYFDELNSDKITSGRNLIPDNMTSITDAMLRSDKTKKSSLEPPLNLLVLDGGGARGEFLCKLYAPLLIHQIKPHTNSLLLFLRIIISDIY